MNVWSAIDTALDRSVVLGYGNLGFQIRRRLPNWPADPPRMTGKVALVTGAGSGLGQAAAVGMARLGASVRVLGRDDDRAAEAARGVRDRAAAAGSAHGPIGEVLPVACDVSSLSGLREFTAAFTAWETRLDVLVNNAGVMPDERRLTADGVELTFATHVLAPWVLVAELAPLLRAAAPSRVINVTSGGQYGQQIPADDPESTGDKYGAKKFYARTKRQQVVLTEQWAGRLRADGVHVHVMHPGWADTKGVRQWLPVFRAATRPLVRTPGQGADTITWLAASPVATESTGLLWHDREPRPTTYRFGAGPDDHGARERLWNYVSSLGQR